MAKITDNSNELSFHQLTSTSSFLLIPLFQRPYVWAGKQLDRMISEIEALCNNEDSSRFLGAIIAVTRPVNPSQPTPHEIVDGQQRLTTLYLFLLAAAQVAAREGRSDYARGLISTNLIVDWAQDLPSNTKLQPSFADRGQFEAIFSKVSNSGDLSDWLPVKLRLTQSEKKSDGPLLKQYNKIHKHLLDAVGKNGFERLEMIVEAVRNGLTFVFILLKDPASATTVFEGLNDPGIPISVGDLVKNEVFSRVGYVEAEARLLHDREWVPFRNKFGESFDDFFFPYCVIHKSNANRTEMFGELRKLWVGLSAKEIIGRLDQYSQPFLALEGRTPLDGIYGKPVASHLGNLVEAKIPSSTYPFLMRLLKSFSNGEIGKDDVVGCLEMLESFLIRRAICGIEPTGLLGLFRTMWSLSNEHPTADKFGNIIFKRLTIEWPSDQRFKEAIKTRPVYGTAISKYVVLAYDRALGRDQPSSEDFSLEHIMPRSPSNNWPDIQKNQHNKLRDLWANLVPLSKMMNGLVDQDPYAKKREIFGKESMFVSTRRLAEKYDKWGEKEINQRSDEIADWAIDRWRRPVEGLGD